MHSPTIFRRRLNLSLLLLGAGVACIGMPAQAQQGTSGTTITQPMAASRDTIRLRPSYTLTSILDDEDCEEDYFSQLMQVGRNAAAKPDLSNPQPTTLSSTRNVSEENPSYLAAIDTIALTSANREGHAALAASTSQREQLAPAAAPVTIASSAPPSSTWELVLTDKTLNAAFARWTKLAGWQLLWELPADYAIEAHTSVPGTFEEAVAVVAKSMENAEVPMKAIFYKGNKVLRIVPRGEK